MTHNRKSQFVIENAVTSLVCLMTVLGLRASDTLDIILGIPMKHMRIYEVTRAFEKAMVSTSLFSKSKISIVLLELYWRLNYYRGALELISFIDKTEISLTLSDAELARKDELGATILFRSGFCTEAVERLSSMRKSDNQKEILAGFYALSKPDRALDLFRSVDPRKLKRSSINTFINLLLLNGSVNEAKQLLMRTESFKKDANLTLARYQIEMLHGDYECAASIARSLFQEFDIFWPENNLLAPEKLFDFPNLKTEHKASCLVSVIMTTFNSAAYLDLSVRSLLKQTYENLEIIIVDDHSTDGVTWEKLEGLRREDNRIKLIKGQQNVGTYNAKNKALDIVQGKFVTFHDSDDWAHPQRIEKQVGFLLANPCHVACQSQWIRIDASGPVLKRWGSFLHTNPASLMIRQDVQRKMGKFDRVRIGADTEYVSRLRETFGAQYFEILKGPLTLGSVRSDALTNSGVGKISPDGYNKWRVDYWASWIRWHIDEIPNHSVLDPLRLERREQHPFPVPLEILHGRF